MNNLGFATSFGLNTNPNAAKNAELANVFGDSDSGEEAPQAPQDVVRFQLEQQRKKVEAQMARQAAEVTKKDPTVFEYDEVSRLRLRASCSPCSLTVRPNKRCLIT